MAIYKVQKVPLISQPTDGVCWYACCRMLYKWSQATGNTGMINPADDEGFHQRFLDNGSWFCGDNKFMASTLKMKQHSSLSLDYDSLSSFMAAHGPIFASVQKNWGASNYPHAIVIAGVADTGVFMHDSMPMHTASSYWLTWGQLSKGLDYVADVANPPFLTAI